MKNFFDSEFAWEFFEKTGSVEGYLFYSEYKKNGKREIEYGNNTDQSTCAENL